MGTSTAFVIHPDVRTMPLPRSADAMLAEAVQLVGAIGLDVVHAESVAFYKPRANTFLGSGYVDRIAELAEEADHPLIVVNAGLSPVQQRNLETGTGCKVIDRTALILEIFGARAQTHAGRLQVELAAMTFQRSRLVRSWTHLERQRGGGGFLGGPGERQIELDRRMIRQKIARLKRDLAEVKRTRSLQRRARQRVPYPIVALVGYTNAGKSTLFNRLTGANITVMDMAEDRLEFCRQTYGIENLVQFKGDGSELEKCREITNGNLFDVVTDATGNPGSMSGALQYVAHTGSLVYVGITTEEISFVHPALHRKEMNLLASRNALPRDFPRIINLIEDGTIDTDPWITHRLGFDEVGDRFEGLIQPDSGVLKAIIEVTD